VSRNLMHVVVCAMLMLTLVMPGAYLLLTLVLAFSGMMQIRRLPNQMGALSVAVGAGWAWSGLTVYTVIGVGLGLWHGYKWAYYEAFVPMLLAPFVVVGVVSYRLAPWVFWLGSAMGAMLAGFLATYQSLFLKMGRAWGALNHPIVFGDLSIVFAMASLWGLVYADQVQSKVWIRLVLIMGAVSGVWASMLSGSKGGWMSVFLVAVAFLWVLTRTWSLGRRLRATVSVVVVLLLIFAMAPHDLVMGRIQHGVAAGLHWFETGRVTDASVSIRLEMWRQSFSMISEKFWLGWSGNHALPEFDRRMTAAGQTGFGFTMENDLIQASVVHGMLGLVAALSLYGGLFLTFWKSKERFQTNAAVGFSVVGMLLVMLMLEFGLSIAVMGRNAFRHVLVTWSMMLIGMMALQAQRSSELCRDSAKSNNSSDQS
jgi:O-antigen ligase